MPALELSMRRKTQEAELWRGRMGRVPGRISANAPWDIWIHAVSVGEVNAAHAIVDAIRKKSPHLSLLVSSSTSAGYKRAREMLDAICGVMPCPLDFPQAVARAVAAVRPRTFATIETELWPCLLLETRNMGAKTALLNGRISSRSLPAYLRIRPAIRPLLERFDLICAASGTYASRLITLGAVEQKVFVTGNAKYEALLRRPDRQAPRALADLLGIDRNRKVVVAGSIRRGEEEPLLKAWELLGRAGHDTVLLMAPRHMKTVPVIEKAIRRRRYRYALFSDIGAGTAKPCDIIVIDRIGILFDLYGLADAAFVGGSLVPRGGQNVLEPAAWSCPVFHGPHTDNFEDAVRALEARSAGGEVKGPEMLAARIKALFDDLGGRQEQGKACRLALEDIAAGAATVQAEALTRLHESRAS